MKDYSINNSWEQKIDKTLADVWLALPDARVFIKDINPASKLIDISDLTFQFKTLTDIHLKLSELLNFKVHFVDLDRILYQIAECERFITEEVEYLYLKDFSEKKQLEIEKNFKGKFIDYRSIEDLIHKYDKSEHFENVYFTFLLNIDNRFGVKVKK